MTRHHMNLVNYPDVSKPALSFIIPWADRAELQRALIANRALLTAPGSEVVIVNGGDLDSLERQVLAAGLSEVQVIDGVGESFNKSTSLNLGVACARGETLLLLDCDITIAEEHFNEALSVLEPDTFVTFAKGRETSPASHPQTLPAGGFLLEQLVLSEMLFANGNRATYEFWRSATGRALCGLMLMHKHHYIAIEGSNSDLQDWGFEDYDLQIRLQAKLGIGRKSAGLATHITHEVGTEASRSASNGRNAIKCMANYERGEFLGTYSADWERWQPKLRRYCLRGNNVDFEESALVRV